MKFLVMSAMLLAVAVATPDYLDTLDDNFDFTQLNHAQLTEVAMCFMDLGPCNDLTLSYKKHYPGVVIDACHRCNMAQKAIGKVFYTRLANELPEVNAKFRKHMDPEDKYFDKFLAAMN